MLNFHLRECLSGSGLKILMGPLQKCMDWQKHRTENAPSNISRQAARCADQRPRTRQPRSSESLTASEGLSLLLRVGQTADCGSRASAHPILKGEGRMSTSLRILASAALLATNLSTFAGAARAAEIIEAPPRIAKAVSHATHRYYYRWGAPSELIEGVRGASPLTVPFYGYGWYPGPAHYYGPPPGLCCRAAGHAVISVMY